MEALETFIVPVEAELRDKVLYPVLLDGETYSDWLSRLATSLGTKNKKLAEYVIRTLSICDKEPSTDSFNARLGMLIEMKPSDDTELLLLCQMVMSNKLALDTMGQFVRTYSLEDRERLTNISTKYMHLYARQLETYKKYKRGGLQTIQVIHSQQAIIGNVYNESGENHGKTKS